MHNSDLNVVSSSNLQRPPISRRRFCRAAAALGSAMLAGTSPRGLPAQAQQPSKGRYVDIHTHLGDLGNPNEAFSVEMLLRWMDESEVAQAAVLPLVSPEAAYWISTTDTVLTETKPHRDRLVPFCCIDPRTSYEGGRKGLMASLERWIERGAKGFGEHKPGIPIDDPRNMALYGACGELKLPVLFHIDALRNMDAPGLPGLERVLKEHPQTTFIGHGPGWWASISGDVKPADLGGYPTGPVAPGGALDALFGKYPNLYGDLSAGSGVGAITRDPKFGREFLIRRADRLMFGSDILRPRQTIGQLELYRQLDLPAEVQAKVFRNNARRILRLAEPA